MQTQAMTPALMSPLVDRLLGFIAQDGCTDAEFGAMASAVFEFQFTHNAPYRRFCQRRGVSPARLHDWRQIPAVPISAFKDAVLSCVPPEACERVFMTSGTTRGEVKGRNHHPTMAVWDASMQRHFQDCFLRGMAAAPASASAGDRVHMLTMFPDERELPNSSLARYLSLASRRFGTPVSRAYVSTTGGLDVQGLRTALQAAVETAKPLALMGASFSFVHLVEQLDAAGQTFVLPAGSRILDTGGYKGQARAVPLDAFYDSLTRVFGVPRERCINMYGMTELSSQFYDAGNAVVPSVKRAPHWVRTRVVEPLTGADVAAGERGVLAHCDLANFNSAVTILTEDVGIAVAGGFLLLGRAEGTQAQGCSIAVQQFLQAARA